ncbi:metal-dependent transcriptional regulator [Acetilactobacillus jinshanensis]|uniref:Manganese transport regulator n=1 Tax=Acetilactobacillus jinshanensis TaxID=1720083 RepID=A0A4P6ZJJ6_9LACO|nr:metal-dependent transcriptional regulator [Acetilactobacillus jinshanensis]QBP17808.1 metal-dependent transcriptional regulator [Acetilactobacillus jinshanensis]URL60670.1 metal-dependent transcriptional regulator [uncultured bacterium]
MSPIKEDYLKIIFELGGTRVKVSNKQIAISLNIAAGSVTEMVNKLLRDGLAKHEPYSGVTLTAKGARLAKLLIWKHRLWEVFLVRKLGFKLSDVDQEADVLEHVTSPKLLKALDKWLGYPRHCPHGGVIPGKDGHYSRESHVVLNDVKDGHTVAVDRFIDNRDLLTYLGDIKLDIGDVVHVVRHAPFDGPVIVHNLTDHTKLTIGYKAAHYIFVRPVKK